MNDERDTKVLGFDDYFFYVALTRLPRSVLSLLQVQEDLNIRSPHRYQARVSLDAAIEAAASDDRRAMKGLFLDFMGFTDALDVDVEIDDEGRIRRLRVYRSDTPKAELLVEWKEFGVEVPFDPPEDDVARPADFVEEFEF